MRKRSLVGRLALMGGLVAASVLIAPQAANATNECVHVCGDFCYNGCCNAHHEGFLSFNVVTTDNGGLFNIRNFNFPLCGNNGTHNQNFCFTEALPIGSHDSIFVCANSVSTGTGTGVEGGASFIGADFTTGTCPTATATFNFTTSDPLPVSNGVLAITDNAVGAPEVDADTMAAPMAMALGALFILADRRRKS